MLNPRSLFLLGHTADAGIDITRAISGNYGFSGLGAGISIGTGLLGGTNRGQLLPNTATVVSGTMGGMATGIAASVLTKGILAKSSIPIIASKLTGGIVSGGVGLTVEMIADAAIRRKILPLANYIKEQGQKYDQFYSNHYTDTNRNYTMRQQSAMELNRSQLNARQYLSSEAQLLHQ